MRAWVRFVARMWTALYTSGMPPELADARRAEIESDLWEQQHDPDGPRGWRAVMPMLLRVVRGVPDDLAWRMELMDLRLRRRRIAVWLSGALTVLVLSGLWLRAALSPPTLPDLPLSPRKMQAWLMRPVPPPPPPPPPPAFGDGRTPSVPPPPPPAPLPRR